MYEDYLQNWNNKDLWCGMRQNLIMAVNGHQSYKNKSIIAPHSL
jgi:hypothetical protein